MKVTKSFRQKVLKAMPELQMEDAQRIGDLEQCSVMTVYRHWKRFKEEDKTQITTIMLAISELAASRKRGYQKRVQKVHAQLSN